MPRPASAISPKTVMPIGASFCLKLRALNRPNMVVGFLDLLFARVLLGLVGFLFAIAFWLPFLAITMVMSLYKAYCVKKRKYFVY